MDRNYFMMKFHIGILYLPILLTFFLIGCGTLIAPKEENLRLSGRYHDATKYIEDREAQGQALSLRERFTLCDSYLQTSIYKKLFLCTEDLERQLESESDHMLFMGVGSVSAMPWIMRARAHLELGNIDQAILEAEKAYSIAKGGSSGYDTNRFTALALLAYAHEKKGNPQQAALYLDKLDKESISFLGWGVQALEKRKAKAFAYFSLKRYREFLEEGEDSLAGFVIGIAHVTGDIQQTYADEFPIRFAKAKALYETGRPEEALKIYGDLISYPQVKQWGNIYWQILFDMGKHSIRIGKNAEGINILEKAISSIEERRSTIDTEAARIGFVGDKQAVYHELINALIIDKQYEKAFEYVERAKSRALVDLLASKKDFALKEGNEQEIGRVLVMNESIEEGAIIQNAYADRNKTRSIQIKAREDLKTKAPELASLVTVTSQPIADLQSLIPKEDALIEYYYRDKDMYAFILSDGKLQTIKLGSEKLTEDVQAFRKLIDTPNSIQFMDLSKRLYRRLFKPLESTLNKRNLIIISHGALHYLPMNALHDGNVYLIDRYSIRMMPSASAMKYLREKKTVKGGGLLVFGNPNLGDPKYDLEYAQREAEEIAKIHPKSKIFVRKEATEGALRKYCKDYSYIHFATHGQFNSDAPLKSALLLAPDEKYNGMLTVDKLYSLNLDSDLVTLSACETGLSKIANGDDLVGLTRGFLYAGSRSIVA
ncbi:MAG: CHAT domain-containing protein, partial [Deltaproteobacteria bacterium]|nr:CHAT domain-containing protein [Deltaproteobacteria bacterium]